MQNKVSGKPDAGEWAEWVNTMKIHGPELVYAAADFQRETLLWAARHFDGEEHADYHWHEVSDILERLAEYVRERMRKAAQESDNRSKTYVHK